MHLEFHTQQVDSVIMQETVVRFDHRVDIESEPFRASRIPVDRNR